LVERGKLEPPEGIVYSTAPATSFDEDGESYVVKGPDPDIVRAETLAHLLAAELGIETPEFALGRYPDDDRGQLYFASVKLTDAMRDVDVLLASKIDAASVVFLGELVTFDAWIANFDRNIGNLLARKRGSGWGLVAIDFEKSQTMRGSAPIVETGSLDPKKLRPTGLLGKVIKPPLQADGFIRRLKELDDMQIEAVVGRVKSAIGAWPSAESTIKVLKQRKNQIDKIIKEIWT